MSNINILHFFDFLNKFNIIPFAFSLIITLNLNQLSNSFIENIISPIVNTAFKNNHINLRDRVITIYGIRFGIGPFLITLIQFLFTLITLYLLYLLYIYVTNHSLEFNSSSK